MHSAQIRANFAQNQPSKRLLRKKAEKSRLMTLKKEGAAHSQCPRPLKNSTRENAMPERPQTLRHCSIKNNLSADYAQSNAARI